MINEYVGVVSRCLMVIGIINIRFENESIVSSDNDTLDNIKQ